MMTYEFELRIDGYSECSAEMADRLYGGGCSDATLSSCNGVVTLSFAREAATLAEATASAMADVARAGYIPASPLP